VEILVLHPGALGDIILALPALELMRLRFPDSRITLAGNLDFTAASAHGYADSLISLSAVPLHRLYAGEPLPAEDVRFWMAFDRVVSWTGAGDTAFTSRLSGTSRCARVAAWRPEPGETRHVSRIFVDSLRPWIGDPGALPLPVIRASAHARREVRQWLASRQSRECRRIAVHPGAGNLEKRWPLERFRELLTRLVGCGDECVIVIEGPGEAGLGCEMIRGLPAERVTAAAGLPLELIAALLSDCSAFIGNDSGIAHLAAAAGCACCVVFGPTDPALWAPLGREVKILREGAACKRCEGRPGCHSCMESVSVDDVWRALRSLEESDHTT
jgi:heptosyltransferase-2